MTKFRFKFHRLMVKFLEGRLSYHREALKNIILTGGSFHFQEGTVTGDELDDDTPSVHVVPSYYDYDADGEASGSVNENFKELA